MNRPTDMQIIEAHDLLDLIVKGETPLNPDDESRQYMRQVRNTLCWILGHDDRGKEFQEKIGNLKRLLEETGGKLRLIQ